MEKNMDELLKHALTPTEEPDYRLNQRIINQVKERSGMEGRGKRRVSAAVLVAVMVLCLSSLTVYAVRKYLQPAEVAEEMQDVKLAEMFLSEQALVINETQSYGGYTVTLLSVISGEMLSEYAHYEGDGAIRPDRTYAVVAIENADGTPMPDASEDAYGEVELFASPLIGGYNPGVYNIAGMWGSYADTVEEGVLYRLLECDNVEIFADHDLYLCVSEGMFYNTDAYRYDKVTGEISRREEYDGLNALFHLPMDESKADPEKAAEYIAGLGLETDISEEKLNVELDGNFTVTAVAENNEESGKAEVLGAGAAEAVELAEYALQYVGNPYLWGGDSLEDGADSSGFTKSVYGHFEVSLPHSSKEQRELGTEVEDLESAQPGDLIFYETPAHVAIYIGDGMIVHAMPEIGICVSEVDFDEVEEIRRIFN